MAACVKTEIYNYVKIFLFSFVKTRISTLQNSDFVISSGESAIFEIAKTMIFNNIAISIGESTIS